MQRHPDYYLPRLQQFCKDTCQRLQLKGRLLLASEGINGTLSSSTTTANNATNNNNLQQFMDALEDLDLVREWGLPSDDAEEQEEDGSLSVTEERLFQGIDWKLSSTTATANGAGPPLVVEPFPDLKVSRVKEIISTGGTVSVRDVQERGGVHLSPREFHRCLREHPDAVLIDVRNTFEHAIGHFVHTRRRTTRHESRNGHL